MAVTLRKSVNGKHGDWWIGDTTVAGKRYRIHLLESKGNEGSQLFERTKKQAEAKYETWMNELKGGEKSMNDAVKIAKSLTALKVKSVKIDELDGVIDAMDISDSTRKNYKTNLAVFKKWVDVSRTIADISFDDVDDFIVWMKSESYKKSTMGCVVGGLSAIFNRIHKSENNPFKGHKIRGDKMDEVISREALTEEQIKKLLDYTFEKDRKWYEVITMTLCTAMRKSDVCMLKWKYVDFEKGVIDFQNIKTGARVVLPIFSKMMEILKARKAAHEDYGDGFNSKVYVFPFFAKWYSSPTSGITTHLKMLMMKSFGIVDDEHKEFYKKIRQFSVKGVVGKNRVSKYDFHALRTTAITNWVKKGVGVEVVVKMTGHKSVGTLMRFYNKTTAADFREVLAGTLPDCLRGSELRKGEIDTKPWND